MRSRLEILPLLFLFTLCRFPVRADIYHRDTHQVIPGTEGITPGPHVQLDYHELSYADLAYQDLSGANFSHSNLTQADLSGSALTIADFTQAVITQADFVNTTPSFTKEQLYATKSYQDRDLRGIRLVLNDLSGWDFSGQNLAGANLGLSSLNGANFTDSNLANADLSSSLTHADLTGASVSGANFSDTTSRGFIREQLYSTLSYANHELSKIRLIRNDLSDWNFADQNLAEASFFDATMIGADLSGANLRGANLAGARLTNANLDNAVVVQASLPSSVISQPQLYSTASYKNRDLTEIDFSGSDLSGWDFSGQDLRGTDFSAATLTDADFSESNLIGVRFSKTPIFAPQALKNVDFRDATINNTVLGNVTPLGFTEDQLYSTASYKAKDLQGVLLNNNDLTSWVFSEQNLANTVLVGSQLGNADLSDANLFNSDLRGAKLTLANLRGANLKNVCFAEESGEGPANLADASFSAETVYNQWTIFPQDFDPEALGLTYVAALDGDFDANGVLDAADVDLFVTGVTHPGFTGAECRSRHALMFDVNTDAIVDSKDQQAWVKDLKKTYFGDADLNGQFDSSDLVQVLGAGTYEAGRVDSLGNVYGVAAGWSEGDWNADGVFDTADLITAFRDGGYELGTPDEAAVVVPEPASMLLCMLGGSLCLGHRRNRRTS